MQLTIIPLTLGLIPGFFSLLALKFWKNTNFTFIISLNCNKLLWYNLGCYMAKFTELARFFDDYVATNMAKVRKFKDGLKFSIRSKIVGLLLQDLDLMVKTAMTIEMEVDNA